MEAYSSALAARAQQAFEEGNAELAIVLALKANLSSPSEEAKQTLASVGYYAPGTRRRFVGHTDKVTSVAFSPDSHSAVSGSADRTVILWDIESGNKVYQFEKHTDSVNSVAISPDGRTILSGSSDKTLILWDTKSGHEIRRFEGHRDKVNSVVFSPDGRTVLSGSSDTTMILWNVETGNIIHRFIGHRGHKQCGLQSGKSDDDSFWFIGSGQPGMSVEHHQWFEGEVRSLLNRTQLRASPFRPVEMLSL